MGIHSPTFLLPSGGIFVTSSLNSCNIAVIMMRDLFVLCLVPLAVLSTPMPYKDDGYDKDAYGGDGDSYTKDDGYGKKLVCKPVYDTIYKEYCENYYDRICRTTHKEKCTDVPDHHCNAVPNNQQKRKCFEVEEVVCKLREDVKYQTVQVGFTVQKCNKVQERVCDTVFDVSSTIKEKSVCINVHNPYCKHEEKTIIDRTCRTSTKFDCPTEYGYGKDDYGKDSYGKDDYGDDYGKDYKKPECHKSSSASCYATPRTVIVPKCSTTSEKVCETVPQRYPDVSERQHCHNEDKKVCQLEESTQTTSPSSPRACPPCARSAPTTRWSPATRSPRSTATRSASRSRRRSAKSIRRITPPPRRSTSGIFEEQNSQYVTE